MNKKVFFVLLFFILLSGSIFASFSLDSEDIPKGIEQGVGTATVFQGGQASEVETTTYSSGESGGPLNLDEEGISINLDPNSKTELYKEGDETVIKLNEGSGNVFIENKDGTTTKLSDIQDATIKKNQDGEITSAKFTSNQGNEYNFDYGGKNLNYDVGAKGKVNYRPLEEGSQGNYDLIGGENAIVTIGEGDFAQQISSQEGFSIKSDTHSKTISEINFDNGGAYETFKYGEIQVDGKFNFYHSQYMGSGSENYAVLQTNGGTTTKEFYGTDIISCEDSRCIDYKNTKRGDFTVTKILRDSSNNGLPTEKITSSSGLIQIKESNQVVASFGGEEANIANSALKNPRDPIDIDTGSGRLIIESGGSTYLNPVNDNSVEFVQEPQTFEDQIKTAKNKLYQRYGVRDPELTKDWLRKGDIETDLNDCAEDVKMRTGAIAKGYFSVEQYMNGCLLSANIAQSSGKVTFSLKEWINKKAKENLRTYSERNQRRSQNLN